MRKTLATAAALCLAILPAAQAQMGPFDARANARSDLSAALTQAATDHKLVLIDFGANWCLDCIVLDYMFEDPTVAPYVAEHFHVVHVDVGRFDRNLDISKRFGRPIDNGVPAVVVLNPDGTIVASTGDGSLESARNMNTRQILALLQTWVGGRQP